MGCLRCLPTPGRFLLHSQSLEVPSAFPASLWDIPGSAEWAAAPSWGFPSVHPQHSVLDVGAARVQLTPQACDVTKSRD